MKLEINKEEYPAIRGDIRRFMGPTTTKRASRTGCLGFAIREVTPDRRGGGGVRVDRKAGRMLDLRWRGYR